MTWQSPQRIFVPRKCSLPMRFSAIRTAFKRCLIPGGNHSYGTNLPPFALSPRRISRDSFFTFITGLIKFSWVKKIIGVYIVLCESGICQARLLLLSYNRKWFCFPPVYCSTTPPELRGYCQFYSCWSTIVERIGCIIFAVRWKSQP